MPINTAILDVDGTVATCPYDFDAMRAAIADIAARHGLDAGMLRIRGVIEHIDALAARLGDDGPAFREEATRAVVNLEVTAAREPSFSRALPPPSRPSVGAAYPSPSSPATVVPPPTSSSANSLTTTFS